MKTIVIASQKGGAGKTTLAAHLAVAAEAAGCGPVALIDTDEQHTLTRWWEQRAADTPVMGTAILAQMADGLEVLRARGVKMVIIDTPPAISVSIQTVIAVADLVVIPVKPSPADLWAVGRTLDLCKAERRPYFFALSMVTHNTKIAAEAAAALSAHGAVCPSLIHQRVGYAASLTDGSTVQELDPKGQAATEIAGLLAFLLARLPDSQKPMKAAKHRVA